MTHSVISSAIAPTSFDLAAFITRFQLHALQPHPPVYQQRKAAVLVPIVCRATPTLLLTRRTSGLRKHAGQVAFPGGAADREDGSLIVTALREAQEEVAIQPQNVRVLGTLPPADSVSGFQVTPVVGLISAQTRFHANKSEVAELFEMPLADAFALARYYPLDIERQEKRHRVYLSWYQQQFVWGLTAAIIRQLAMHVASKP
ncbi:8-oxo-dGTP pyrophosphatase MutT (NUDIX family)|uniref:8-oxo-dGTP pyrophosphatase MutT (NUDIX family) n=1 Tax=Brenneria salicis ATCC 15712 = DSM 30166 TaxID=714314 RepID=A0A366I4Q0_9GAMM|nr:8-oxo-dGTP pyrophosphatase MutT (NUDIX family) [Brenneria salicis ATCC 15712 = DSM 30166]RBP63040.1 8-oxo-dGTP pyrophosphatase MutT (NUDIX family) [Brenneria salicis ATCC 15712 = DSM 30166]